MLTVGTVGAGGGGVTHYSEIIVRDELQTYYLDQR